VRFAGPLDVDLDKLRYLEMTINNVIGEPEPVFKKVQITNTVKAPSAPAKEQVVEQANSFKPSDKPLDITEPSKLGPAVRITSPYGQRMHPIKKKKHLHNGVDLALAKGEKIYSVADGKVIVASYNKTSGNFVTISHGKTNSSYAHLSKKLVNKGAKVKAGQAIGLVGSTGSATGNHLHFIMRDVVKGKWIPRAPTGVEMSKVVGGRLLDWGKHSHSSLKITILTNSIPLTKKAVQVSIEPYYSVVQEAVQEIESKQPGYFSQVNHIIVEPSSPDHFGKVQSDKPDTIYVSLDKIKSTLQGVEGEDQIRAAVREVLTHEMGHLNAKFEGGEAPAETESKRMDSYFK